MSYGKYSLVNGQEIYCHTTYGLTEYSNLHNYISSLALTKCPSGSIDSRILTRDGV
jgi:hypothetical protein